MGRSFEIVQHFFWLLLLVLDASKTHFFDDIEIVMDSLKGFICLVFALLVLRSTIFYRNRLDNLRIMAGIVAILFTIY